MGSIPTQTVLEGVSGTRAPENMKINPTGTVPFLLMADDTPIAESIPLCELFDESVPGSASNPSVFGADATQRAQTRMWQRRVELMIAQNILNWLHYGPLVDTFKQLGPVVGDGADEFMQMAIHCEIFSHFRDVFGRLTSILWRKKREFRTPFGSFWYVKQSLA